MIFAGILKLTFISGRCIKAQPNLGMGHMAGFDMRAVLAFSLMNNPVLMT